MSVQWVSQKIRQEVVCYRNLNLLAHAQMEEIDTGSQCGGHGVCGRDRVLILEGRDDLSPITEVERKHLSLEELEEGYRLACQAWPHSDDLHFVVEIRD